MSQRKPNPEFRRGVILPSGQTAKSANTYNGVCSPQALELMAQSALIKPNAQPPAEVLAENSSWESGYGK